MEVLQGVANVSINMVPLASIGPLMDPLTGSNGSISIDILWRQCRRLPFLMTLTHSNDNSRRLCAHVATYRLEYSVQYKRPEHRYTTSKLSFGFNYLATPSLGFKFDMW